jgi:oligopeptide transport system substrate-binding protein
MRSIRLAEGLAAAALACVCACREPYPHPRHRGAGATVPRDGGTLHLAMPGDLAALDPANFQEAETGAIVSLLFDTLVDHAPGTFDLRPALAERWEVADGGQTLRFFLREGVRFHDGTPLGALDVKASLERLLDPERASSWATSQFDRIAGYDDFRAHRAPHLDGVAALDERTVEIRLESPDASALERFALGPSAIVPVARVDRVGREAFGVAPVGSGPYELESWERGTRIVLRKNPRYFHDGVAHASSIVIDLNVPSSSIAMRLQRGDVDLAVGYWLGQQDVVWFRREPGWNDTLAVAPVGEVAALCMNTEIPPWNNRALRRAVAYAIDREALTRPALGTLAPLYTLYPPGIPGHDPDAPWAQRFDVESARHEMVAAGYPDGLPEEQEIWYVGGAPGPAVLIQADLARIGVRVRFHAAGLDYGALTRRGQAPLSLCGWIADFPDPVDFAEVLFHSRAVADEGSPNVSFYANPDLDVVLDRARAEQDPRRRTAMYADAERIILEDAPWAMLSSRVRIDVVHPYVRDYHVGMSPPLDLRGLWLDEPRRAWSSP